MVPAATEIVPLVLGVMPKLLASEAVTVLEPATFRVTAKLLEPEESAALAGNVA